MDKPCSIFGFLFSIQQELVDQAEEIRFNVSVKAVSILRYIVDHMSRQVLSACLFVSK